MREKGKRICPHYPKKSPLLFRSSSAHQSLLETPLAPCMHAHTNPPTNQSSPKQAKQAHSFHFIHVKSNHKNSKSYFHSPLVEEPAGALAAAGLLSGVLLLQAAEHGERGAAGILRLLAAAQRLRDARADCVGEGEGGARGGGAEAARGALLGELEALFYGGELCFEAVMEG